MFYYSVNLDKEINEDIICCDKNRFFVQSHLKPATYFYEVR